MAKTTLLHGDVVEQLKNLPDESVDAIIQDPPYNLAFMNKNWDAKGGPQQFQKWCEDWATECFRVLRKGGLLLSFGGTRTYHRMTSGIEDAGFQIRDCITWLYGTGFPKSLNISKALDKRGGEETTGERWDGYGTALKPASEPIVVAQKPREGTFITNVIKHGVGPLNIDACRIPLNGDTKTGGFGNGKVGYGGGDAKGVEWQTKTDGRWPANVILSHHPACGFSVEESCEPSCPIHGVDEQSGDRSGTRIGNPNEPSKKEGNEMFGGNKQDEATETHCYRDTGGASRYFKHADWECEDGCAIHILDEQSGITKSTVRPPTGKPLLSPDNENRSVQWNANNVKDTTLRGHNDVGGASRFFSHADWECHEDCPVQNLDEQAPNVGNAYQGLRKSETTGGTGHTLTREHSVGESAGVSDGLSGASKFFYCAKASKSEKMCNGAIENKHPTVKPVKLIEWLIKLVCPEEYAMQRQPIILDCFLGSGTTAVAAQRLGVDCIGIELNEEYIQTAYERIHHDAQIVEANINPVIEGWKPDKSSE